MPSVREVRTEEVMIELTEKDVLEAIQHAAWSAAVKNNPSVAVEKTPPRILSNGYGGYSVYYVKAPKKDQAA